MHAGQIVACDTPRALLAALGDEVLEVRVERDPDGAIGALRRAGLAGDDAYAVGTTITVPVRGRPTREIVTAVARLELRTTSLSSRRPTLDDVYLRLTGDALAA
jgi:ABC-2 type transport system ATP-binding protein